MANAYTLSAKLAARTNTNNVAPTQPALGSSDAPPGWRVSPRAPLVDRATGATAYTG